MNKKTVIIIAVSGFVAGVAAFYGGISYNQRQIAAAQATRQQQFGGGRGMRANGGVVAGDILASDTESITVKLSSGGSKIVFVSGATSVLKSTEGSRNDLKVGDTVVANGTPNPDGSITAQSVQIRPALPAPK